MSDYISRDALLNSTSVLAVYSANEDIVSYGVSFDTIRDFPAADVAPVVHAHWIEHIDDYENYCECSNCHEYPYGPLNETMFCPNCGARMDGKESR